MAPKKKSGATSAKNFVGEMNATAERLTEVRMKLKTREDDFKKETDGLYAEEASLKTELLEALKTIGLSSVKTASGDAYVISHKHRYLVKNPIAMEAFARDNRCVTVNQTLLKQRFAKAHKEGTLPDWVEPEAYDSISLRSAKKDAEETASESG